MRAARPSREEEFSHWVLARRLDNFELAAHDRVSVGTIRDARELFNPPRNAKSGGPIPADPPPRPLPFTTYEEDGRTIKRYAPGYALGAITTPFTARSRR